MTLEKKIELADGIRSLIMTHLSDVWPGFTPCPFILYDNKTQVGIGEVFPKRFTQIRDDIWSAEGNEPTFFGCTVLEYEGITTAIWNTATWSEDVDINEATSLIVHEIFHAYQRKFAEKKVGNMMGCASYPHSPLSVFLTIKENELLAAAAKESSKDLVLHIMEKIFALRSYREKVIGQEYMGIDDMDETYEGTAAYAESKMTAILKNISIVEAADNYIKGLHNKNDLLEKYRARCYMSGLALCLVADVLTPNWHKDFEASDLSIFAWVAKEVQATALAEVFTPDSSQLDEAKAIVGKFMDDKATKINEFMNQPTVTIEHNVSQGMLDPMDIVILNNQCLHLKGGGVTLDGVAHTLSFPYVSIFGEHLWDVSKIILPEDWESILPVPTEEVRQVFAP